MGTSQLPAMLVVFGATGGTGTHLVRLALAAGYRVTAVARRPDDVTEQHPRLLVRAGDVMDPATLPGVLDGADAVLSAIGPRDGRRPTSVCSQGTATVAAEMRRADVRRLVVVSAVPVSPQNEKSVFDRRVVHPLLHRFFGHSYDDLGRMEAALRATDDLDWTIVRPPRLTEGPPSGYRAAIESRLARGWQISRADLATGILAGLHEPAWTRRAVTVAH